MHAESKRPRRRHSRPATCDYLSSLPDLALHARIDADLRRILATHRVEPLADAVRGELDAIRARFAASYRPE